jgi:hypothetical protein
VAVLAYLVVACGVFAAESVVGGIHAVALVAAPEGLVGHCFFFDGWGIGVVL